MKFLPPALPPLPPLPPPTPPLLLPPSLPARDAADGKAFSLATTGADGEMARGEADGLLERAKREAYGAGMGGPGPVCAAADDAGGALATAPPAAAAARRPPLSLETTPTVRFVLNVCVVVDGAVDSVPSVDEPPPNGGRRCCCPPTPTAPAPARPVAAGAGGRSSAAAQSSSLKPPIIDSWNYLIHMCIKQQQKDENKISKKTWRKR